MLLFLLLANQSINQSVTLAVSHLGMSAPRPSYNHPDEPLTAARLSLIPRDETPAQRRQRLALEAEARQVSDEIDERLRQEHMQSRRKKVVKVLLLGWSLCKSPHFSLQLQMDTNCVHPLPSNASQRLTRSNALYFLK